MTGEGNYQPVPSEGELIRVGSKGPKQKHVASVAVTIAVPRGKGETAAAAVAELETIATDDEGCHQEVPSEGELIRVGSKGPKQKHVASVAVTIVVPRGKGETAAAVAAAEGLIAVVPG